MIYDICDNAYKINIQHAIIYLTYINVLQIQNNFYLSKL